jgi:hypothetical protein
VAAFDDAGGAAAAAAENPAAAAAAENPAAVAADLEMDLCDVAALLQLLGNLALLDGAVNYEPWTAPSPTRCSPC